MTPAAATENGRALVSLPLYWPQELMSSCISGLMVEAAGRSARSAKMPFFTKSAVAWAKPRVTTSGGSLRTRPGTKLPSLKSWTTWISGFSASKSLITSLK